MLVDVILSVILSFKQFSMQMWVHIQNQSFICNVWNYALIEFWGWRLCVMQVYRCMISAEEFELIQSEDYCEQWKIEKQSDKNISYFYVTKKCIFFSVSYCIWSRVHGVKNQIA